MSPWKQQRGHCANLCARLVSVQLRPEGLVNLEGRGDGAGQAGNCPASIKALDLTESGPSHTAFKMICSHADPWPIPQILPSPVLYVHLEIHILLFCVLCV